MIIICKQFSKNNFIFLTNIKPFTIHYIITTTNTFAIYFSFLFYVSSSKYLFILSIQILENLNNIFFKPIL